MAQLRPVLRPDHFISASRRTAEQKKQCDQTQAPYSVFLQAISLPAEKVNESTRPDDRTGLLT